MIPQPRSPSFIFWLPPDAENGLLRSCLQWSPQRGMLDRRFSVPELQLQAQKNEELCLKQDLSEEVGLYWLPVVLPPSWEQREMEKRTGKKRKTQTPKEEVNVPKDTSEQEKVSGNSQPNKSSTLAKKPSKEPGLNPDDEEHIFDDFDASFKDDFEGVPGGPQTRSTAQWQRHLAFASGLVPPSATPACGVHSGFGPLPCSFGLHTLGPLGPEPMPMQPGRRPVALSFCSEHRGPAIPAWLAAVTVLWFVLWLPSLG
ncbi:hypothetical protein HPG69_014818 [Diceros bicornis minor]|uniref:Uncharacterized protein n=1 Tax=Diceros bicornis minor TaxID=77932 RepID=A0A7J7F9Q9_DICBM|nr:hypothetical protein HPG69_014818 [Diceros bicornis minor]